MKGASTSEYLIIIAVALVIGIIASSLLGVFPISAPQAAGPVAAAAGSPFSVTEMSKKAGSLTTKVVLQNNAPEKRTLEEILAIKDGVKYWTHFAALPFEPGERRVVEVNLPATADGESYEVSFDFFYDGGRQDTQPLGAVTGPGDGLCAGVKQPCANATCCSGLVCSSSSSCLINIGPCSDDSECISGNCHYGFCSQNPAGSCEPKCKLGSPTTVCEETLAGCPSDWEAAHPRCYVTSLCNVEYQDCAVFCGGSLCRQTGEPCLFPSDCCAGVCNGVCSCAGAGQSCIGDAECCSGLICNANACSTCKRNSEGCAADSDCCQTPSPQICAYSELAHDQVCQTCLDYGENCAGVGRECCDGYACIENQCIVPYGCSVQGGQCTYGSDCCQEEGIPLFCDGDTCELACAMADEECGGGIECCSGLVCALENGTQSCVPCAIDGTECASGLECCSGFCNSNSTCAQNVSGMPDLFSYALGDALNQPHAVGEPFAAEAVVENIGNGSCMRPEISVAFGGQIVAAMSSGSQTFMPGENITIPIEVACNESGVALLEVVADPRDWANESDETNNNATYAINCTAANATNGSMPDLIAAGDVSVLMASHPLNEPFSVPVTTRNTGNGGSGAPTLTNVSFAGSMIASLPVPPLESGANNTQNVTIMCTSSGGFEFKVFADARLEVAESDEQNNEWSYTVPCGDLPDLRSYVDEEAISLPIRVGFPTSISVNTRNMGQHASAGASNTLVFFNNSLISNFSIPPMGPKGFVQNTTRITCPRRDVFEFGVIADGGRVVFESNESNNYWNYSIHCGELPDLIANASLPELSAPQSTGIPFTVSVYTYNIGNVTAGAATRTRVLFGGLEVTNISISSMHPLSNHSQNVTLTCPSGGLFTFEAIADANRSVQEENENNNEWNYTVKCITPPYTLTINASNTAPDVLEPVFFNYSLMPDVPLEYLNFTWQFGPFNCYDGVLENGSLTNGSDMSSTPNSTIRYLCPTIPPYAEPRQAKLIVKISRPGEPVVQVASNNLSIPVSFCSKPNCPYESYDDVLLVVNNRSATSMAIGDYFASARGIQHRIDINVTTNEGIWSYPASLTTFREQIKAPIVRYLQENGLVDKINYIVTTKGVPNGFTRNDETYSSYYSVDNRLTTILGPWENDAEDSSVANPYADTSYGIRPVFSRAKFGTYLVTRLMGYTQGDSINLVNRANGNRDSGIFVFDKSKYPGDPGNTSCRDFVLNTRINTARERLQALGVDPSRFVSDDACGTYLYNQQNVLMYVSWASNDGHSRSPWEPNHARPNNAWAPGSIAETYMSYSGRTYNSCPPYYNVPDAPYCTACNPRFYQRQTLGQDMVLPAGTVLDAGVECGQQLGEATWKPAGTQIYNFSIQSHSLISDWIGEGAAGASGYVDEPYTSGIADISILFPRYYQGYGLADSFYSSAGRLEWMAIYSGDPKGRLR